jgi:hypothetical protein
VRSTLKKTGNADRATKAAPEDCRADAGRWQIQQILQAERKTWHSTRIAGT